MTVSDVAQHVTENVRANASQWNRVTRETYVAAHFSGTFGFSQSDN